jgi:hypothetical protein
MAHLEKHKALSGERTQRAPDTCRLRADRMGQFSTSIVGIRDKAFDAAALAMVRRTGPAHRRSSPMRD